MTPTKNTRRGTRANRPEVSDLPDALVETALAYNWLDAELYELCRETQKRRLG